ncbi:MAG: glycosyltransferase [Burkholderiaceae bacterium]|nr:glycosyltransferase [Burkholderiaceae bacterium]
MIVLTLISAAISMLVALLFIRWAGEHAQQYEDDKPQRFHIGAVPRLGGLAIMLGLFAGWLTVAWSGWFGVNLNVQGSWPLTWPWLLLTLPAVLGGAYEDMTQRLSVLYRLGLTAVSAALACWLLGISLDRLGIPLLDSWLHAVPWAGVLLAVFAICGLPHAFNIIDGYNGLAGTVAAMICLAIAHVALQLGDRQLAAMVVCLAGATAGFLIWNYPRGLIFAGDGGAYLWGVVIAVASIVLVQRHSTVSPWFPMLLLIYPVWETLFSIYRKVARGVSPGVADALHFHQLIYRRLVRGVFHDDASRRMLMRNNRTSPWLWSFTLLTVAPAVLFWDNTAVLMALCALFIISYVAAYMMLVRFKVPRWLRR